MSALAPTFVGIDVSKTTLDVATYPCARHTQVVNTPQGYHQLQTWLQDQSSVTQIALEASGRYGEAVAAFLVAQGYPVSYLNPRQVAAFARVKTHYQKTDKQDAKLIAEYCHHFKPDLYQPITELRKRLQQLSRRLDTLNKLYRQEDNRLQSGLTDPFVIQQLQRHLDYLNALIAETKQAIHDLVTSNDRLQKQHRLLTSITGIGDKTAYLILAEIDIDQFTSARKLAAYIGITPKQFQSGTSVNKHAHISKQGNAHLRAGLYMPAIVAKRWNKPCRHFAHQLQNRHKPQKVIVIAVMRKLVHQIFGILKSGQPFDPDFEQLA